MDQQSSARRLPAVSAHAIALAALFVALGSGAYAAVSNIAPNSVGAEQLLPDSVGSSELAKKVVDKLNMKLAAVGTKQMADDSVTQAKLKALSVGAAQMQPNSVGAAQIFKDSIIQAHLQANSVGQAQMQPNSVGRAQMVPNSVGQEQLAPEATTTLYTDNNDAGQTINTDTQIGALSLPAGSYLVSAGVQAVHTGAASSTRLECYIVNGAAVVDFAKVRLQPNTDPANSLIFGKAMLQGPATLASDGALTLRCATADSGGSPIALDRIHFSALRVGAIVAQ